MADCAGGVVCACDGPVAATLRDKNKFVDLTGRAKIRWQTRSAGFHVVRPVLKLADGTWLIGDHADGDGTTENFIETEFSIASSIAISKAVSPTRPRKSSRHAARLRAPIRKTISPESSTWQPG